jgi:arginine/ornithine N-succinyltransferase beta subunit
MRLQLNELGSTLLDMRPYPPSRPRPSPLQRPQHDAGRGNTAADKESFRYLVARPAVATDLAAIMQVAGHVNLASMRAEEARNKLAIEQSTRTLAGELPWQQGLLLLAADLFPFDNKACELAGQIKLQVGWGGCWKKTRQSRLFQVPGVHAWADQEFLSYQANPHDQYALELAGLSVLPRHQGKRIARFLAQSWALFILLYQKELQRRIGTIAHLYANVLTADAQGKFPFYERVVRPLFGGLDYDTVDNFRSARCNARSPILDEFLDSRGDQPSARIACHLLPEGLRNDLGKVRPQSMGCARNLEQLGFCRTDKYDVLDGGQYFENTLARLDATLKRDEQRVRPVPEEQIPADAPRLTVAPIGRPMSSFRCVRARCHVVGRELLISEEAFDALLVRRHEPVTVLQPRMIAQETTP